MKDMNKPFRLGRKTKRVILHTATSTEVAHCKDEETATMVLDALNEKFGDYKPLETKKPSPDYWDGIS